MAVPCQRCNKVLATVHLTDLLQGEKHERHLCGDCAEQEGLIMKSHQAPLNEILQKFVKQKGAVQELADLKCENCGMTFAEFRSHGLLGCPNDYDAFSRALEPLIERSHEDALQHVGKVVARMPEGTRTRHRLLQLHRELKQALQQEEYERAARLRDEIQELESS